MRFVSDENLSFNASVRVLDNTGGAREATFSNGLILTLFTSLEIDAPLNEYIPQELIPNIMAIKQIYVSLITADTL